jgi:hypothetical protein
MTRDQEGVPEGGLPRDQSLEAASLFLAGTQGLVDDLRELRWDAHQPLAPVLSRAVICRQHDYLAVAAGLARERRGWAIVPLLRPACEELVWLAVLADVKPEARERILKALATLDVEKDLRAQDRYLGREAMRSLGYGEAVLAAGDERRQQATSELRSAFSQIGLGLGPRQSVPSVAALADRADRRRLYDFIYHATSTTVHFKPGQLMRAIWGEPGDLRIDFAPIEGRLADFGMYWAVRLALETFGVALALTSSDGEAGRLDVDALERSARTLSAAGVRPFVLPDELVWPAPS